MVSEENRTELLKKIHDSVVEFEEETSVKLCTEALNEGIDPYDAHGNGGGIV